MIKQMLKGIRVASKEELLEQMYLYFDEINAEPEYIIEHIKWTRLILGNLSRRKLSTI